MSSDILVCRFCSKLPRAVDLGELEHQADVVSNKLAELLAHMEQEAGRSEVEASEFSPLVAEEDRLSVAEREKIDSLFSESAADRSKAYELKRELDRLGVFADYENRFLDLFKKKN